jgi:membrane-bound ClpP family serine protease
MGLIISLILIGLVLMLAEVLIIPGVGVAGILGLLSMGGSCYYAFHEFGNVTGGIVSGVNGLLLLVLMIYVLRAKTWKRFALETNIDSKAVLQEHVLTVGDRGKTVTRLSPMGAVRVGDNVVEVKALEGMIDPGVEVEVVLIEDNRIYVSPSKLL